MKVIVIGLGIQGKKRMHVAGADCVGTVDTARPGATYKRVEEAPLNSFDAALVCTPDEPKIEILKYLLSHGKHVLVEKPLFAQHSSELRELAQLAKSNHATCYTAYNHRFEPHFIHLKQAVECGKIGKLLLARFFYGNGTARDVRNSEWRDRGAGVLPDIGSHLLDTMDFIFGEKARKWPYELWSGNCLENQAYDHVLVGAKGSSVIELEATLLSWRNTFTADVIGDQGSVHISGLCKWGPSVFTVRERVLPSGRPKETVQTLEQPDPTWNAEYAHFQDLCQKGQSNIENDVWINDTLKSLSSGAES